MNLTTACDQFVDWLDRQVTNAGRGDHFTVLNVEPRGRFWLGRLAPEVVAVQSALGERGERLDPCAVGLRIRPSGPSPWNFTIQAEATAWIKSGAAEWQKTSKFRRKINVTLQTDKLGVFQFGQDQIESALAEVCGIEGLSAVVRVELRKDHEGKYELTLLLVNCSPAEHPGLKDTNLYECSIEVHGLATEPFVLESLPDSFRYDRRVPAYGVNCGVKLINADVLRTTDTVRADKHRPKYWNVSEPKPDLTFLKLSKEPVESLQQLCSCYQRWGKKAWGIQALEVRATQDVWSQAMFEEAKEAASDFETELDRLSGGLKLLIGDQQLLRAFKLMNRGMSYSVCGQYDSWRPFQLGFLLCNLASIVQPDNDATVADVIWFATGGGKTETYLGLLVTAAFYDRLRGKLAGITAWSRFPLRMLSLQQTQRFADAMAGAERVRREESIPGDPLSVGFFVGQGATPNSLKEDAGPGEANIEDPGMPDRYRILLKCPFCHSDKVSMDFDRRYWRLVHRCSNEECPWPEKHLPFFIVDDEIYRFLPTIVVGTLDKAAIVAMQAGMRGFIGSPLGICSEDSHGYVYAPRSVRPNGCFVPGCVGSRQELGLDVSLYAPSFRLQDELHLLKDSLGAVDAHYESLLDDLQCEISGRKPKILASSATLSGYERQVRLLYQRDARVFPLPGPSDAEGFWSASSFDLARRYVAVAPRGVTVEYAVDRTITELQRAIRKLAAEPETVCAEAGIAPAFASDLVSLYGVNVVYGNTIRDLDAVARSLETQIAVEGPLNTASLTGRTEFEEVRRTLERLQAPEDDFGQRIHVITASSMMSHGVDIDRLNLMVMIGVPLTAAEFIQSSSRIGRARPGIIYVMHKIARERDASVFRSFDKFVLQGDRFIEPISITRHSRRVLEKTMAGVAVARILAIYEAKCGGALTTVSKLRDYFRKARVSSNSEVAAVIKLLGFEDDIDENLRIDLATWYELFFQNLTDPAGTFTFISDLSPSGRPMRSLRDVEEEVPVIGV